MERRTLTKQLDSGELTDLEFEAVVYRQGADNRNPVLFRDEDLEAFAASFVGQPFLRNHDTGDIASRDGTILASFMSGHDMIQRISLTTQRGMRAFLEGTIDRFSIGWFYDEVLCSICNRDWLDCEHYPGRKYKHNLREVQCRLIFINPRGKETSAVNAPAVPDTHVITRLCSFKETRTMNDSFLLPDGTVHQVPPAAPPPAAAAATAAAAAPASASDNAAILQEMRAMEARHNARLSDELIEGAHLSPQSKSLLRLACTGKSPEETSKLVLAQQHAEAAALDQHLVRGIKPIGANDMVTPHDRLQNALDWIFGLPVEPPPPSLRDMRNIYQFITGDSNWYGVFNPEWSQLASATTVTLAGMVVDALNRVTRMHYDNMVTYRWYENIIAVTPHSGTTHDLTMIMVDGLASLPVVSEGAAYSEATVGDSKETAAFVKYGHYVGITLETIRKSDIQRIQAIPRELVKAAIRTRSAAIAAIFTVNAGTGPTLADDSTVLFHANHGNVNTTAFDAAGWAGIRTDIWEQQIPGTSKPLGLWPSYCLVPIELYDTALTVFGYGAGDVGMPIAAATAQSVNPYGASRIGDPRPTVIAVPEWSEVDHWAAIVDPRLHPVIHMAYANNPAGGSHPMPEIFEVNSETSGLMFSNDTLPVKVRDWWAYGVSTWVGVAKMNV